jgi:predicted DCC family thiol-disulfide oxidoreductase YuxK
MRCDPIDTMLEDLAPAGVICYDADCSVCRRAVRWLQRLNRHGFAFMQLQHPAVRERIGHNDEIPDEFKLLRAGRPILGGAPAIIAVMRSLPATRMLAPLAASRIGFAVIDRAYRWIAEHRHCHFAHSCSARAVVRDRVWLGALLASFSEHL